MKSDAVTPDTELRFSVDRPGPRQLSASDLALSTLLTCPRSAIFFIAGLLYLLRFERADNLGAYRIPPETGLLIPSVFDS